MAPTSESQQGERVRKRGNVQKQEEQEQQSKPVQPSYTPEQAEAVKRIKKCKDYYEILMVTKDATDIDIKKQYKKLALQLHPDKNHYPGAGEAFKAIGMKCFFFFIESRGTFYDFICINKFFVNHRKCSSSFD